MRFRPLLSFLVLALPGCAYTFNPSSIPGHLKTLQIPTADNQTLEVSLAQELTQALTDRFVRDNVFKVVQDDADAVLDADITHYENRVSGFNAEQQADEYMVIMTVKMALRDRVKNKVIWSDDNVQGRASYTPGASGSAVGTEEDARKLAYKQIVDFVVARSTEGW
jgi:outer membrane lipopolysaccharide assembly protein LptE/RlpB